MFGGDLIEPETTGNLIVEFEDSATTQDMLRILGQVADGQVAAASDFAGEGAVVSAGGLDAVMFETLKTAVVRVDEASSAAAALNAEQHVRQARPEFYFYPIDWASRRRGWLSEGVKLLVDFEGEPSPGRAEADFAETLHSAASTWGVEAVGALANAALTGAGIRVAVLDTGFDLGHPDFAGRTIQAFDLTGSPFGADDRQGHGTHVAGTVCGPAKPAGGAPRYGVAPEAELFVYKVLNDSGRGTESQIHGGMDRAIAAGCVVMNMSLGRPAGQGAQPDAMYERLGRRALQAGTLIVAAAGNNSARDLGHIAPVGYPANSPSILAVGALDRNLKVATFSCGGLNGGGGAVDMGAPGVDVLSAAPRSRGGYASLQGTSMAAPHVTGLAALVAQQTGLRGEPLWLELIRRARRLSLPPRDAGAGLSRL